MNPDQPFSFQDITFVIGDLAEFFITVSLVACVVLVPGLLHYIWLARTAEDSARLRYFYNGIGMAMAGMFWLDAAIGILVFGLVLTPW
jgi:apolipoprotein N-acyltransferase